MTPPVNQKSFTLINRISKSFSVAIANFAYAATFLFNIRFKINLVFSPKINLKAVSNIVIKKVRIIISQVKLITSITQTINLRKVSIVAIARERLANTLTILSRVRMTIISTARQRLISTILIKKVTISATPTLATFFSLGYFDPETLGDLDGLTLGEMDYTT